MVFIIRFIYSVNVAILSAGSPFSGSTITPYFVLSLASSNALTISSLPINLSVLSVSFESFLRLTLLNKVDFLFVKANATIETRPSLSESSTLVLYKNLELISAYLRSSSYISS